MIKTRLPSKIVSIFAVLALSLTCSALASEAASTTCNRLGLTKIVAKKSFKCVKFAGKLTWRKQTTSRTAPTKPSTKKSKKTSPVESYASPTIPSDDPSSCKLIDKSTQRTRWGHLISGFPLIENGLPNIGTIRVAMIPIDFQDLPGDADVISRVSDQMKLMTDFYDMASEGRVKFDWVTQKTWIRVPGISGSFSLDRSRSDTDTLAHAAFTASDPNFDFTNVKAVYFVLPKGQTFLSASVQGFIHSSFGANGGFLSAEGRILNYSIAGAYFDQQYKNVWSFWAHETGHMFPMPDLYDVNSQPWIGKVLPIPGGPFSGYDLMANQDGPTRTISTWMRFVIGWVNDSQVYCKPLANFMNVQVMINPVNNRTSGIKSVLIPVSESRVIVIESRRHDEKYDCVASGRNGIIVYTADMTLGHGEGFQALVAPAGRGLVRVENCSAPEQLDAVMKVGDQVVVEGLTIKFIKSLTFDTVTISK